MPGGRSWLRVSVVVAAALLAFAPLAPRARAQVSTDDRAAPRVSPTDISGRVTNADGDRPLTNARVSLASDIQRVPIVLMTDRDGAFRTQIPGTGIVAVVTKTGYSPVRVSTTGRPPLDIRLLPSAVITGRAIDVSGAPVIGQRIEAEPVDGSVLIPAPVSTNDRGEFRLAGLAAGRYRVFALLPPVGGPTFVDGRTVFPQPRRVFAPGVLEPSQATELDVTAGEESAVDLALSIDLDRSLAEQGFFAPPPNSFVEPAVSDAEAVAVRGRALGTDGQPIRDAVVQLQGRSIFRTTQTGLDGEYEFTGLPPRPFDLVAMKERHQTLGPSTGPPRRAWSLNLRPGETRSAIDFVLTPWSTMTGRIVDEYGDPVHGARVQLMKVRYERGRQRLVGTGANVRTTNDLGEYRLWNVSPGQYLVSVTVGEVMSAELPGYGRSYFPGTSDPGASSYVTVGSGQEVTGIHITLVPQPTFRISGRLLDSSGRGTSAGSLSLLPSVSSDSPAGIAVGARIERDGSFEFVNVVPGSYVIQSAGGRTGPANEGETAVVAVTVANQDVRDLLVRRTRGARITGYVVADTTVQTTRSFAGARVSLVPDDADYDLPNARGASVVDRDQQFSLQGINGPRRFVVSGLPAGWALDRISIGLDDVTDRAIDFGREETQVVADVEVVLTNQVSVLQGTFTDRNARPVSGGAVVVFSADRDRWFPGSRFVTRAVSRDDGAYRVEGMPPGTYHVAPLTRAPEDEGWTDPAYLETLIPQALTVWLTEGQATVANITGGTQRF